MLPRLTLPLKFLELLFAHVDQFADLGDALDRCRVMFSLLVSNVLLAKQLLMADETQ